MDMVDRDEFRQWMSVLRDDIKGVHVRLDAQNGRTRTLENKVAVLEDRGEHAKDPKARWGAVGAGFAGLVGALYQWLKP